MSRWSSFKSQQILTENWRKFLQEEEEESEEEAQVVYGLTSDKNPDSLKRLLSGVIGDEVATQIINLIASAADDEGVMLEAVSLQGSKSEQDRVFSGETTREILQGLVSLNLGDANLKNIVKVLNKWGRLNTVKFEKPVAATPVTPVEEPDEAPEAEPTSGPAPTEEPTPDGGLSLDDDEEETEEMSPVVDPATAPSFELDDDYEPTDEENRSVLDSSLRAVYVPFKIMEDTYKAYANINAFVEDIQEDREEIKALYDEGEYLRGIDKARELYSFLRSERSQETLKMMKRLWEGGGIDRSASDMTDAEIDETLEDWFDYIID